MQLKVIAFVLAIVAAATCCVAQDNAQLATDVQRMNYPEFGFDLAVPRSSIKTSSTASKPGSLADAFYHGQMVLMVAVIETDNNQSPAAAIEEMFANSVQKLNMGPTSCTTTQGVKFAGAGGVITLKEEISKIHPLAKKLTEEATQTNPMVQQLFASKIPISFWLFATPLPGSQDRVLIVSAGGPPDNPSQVDTLARAAAASAKFTRLGHGAEALRPQSPIKNLGLTPGHIALYGEIKSIKAESKQLILMADKVVAYGQKPVALKPAREKIVMFSELPKELAAGRRILVIGKNTGTGKPITADTIKLESPAAVTK